MAKMFYQDLWKSSYLLEIVPATGSPEYFAFSLPPESVEYVFTPRVAETKTFGGMFFDDYGDEPCRITISGSTGNADLKKIYRGPQSELWLNGKDEIFYIRDQIVRYKERFGDSYDKVRMNLYNLSAANAEDLANNQFVSTDSWEVRLKDFKLSRSKDKPFQHSFSIDFLGLRILGETKRVASTQPANLLSEASFPFEQLAKVDQALALYEDPDMLVAVALGEISKKTLARASVAESEIFRIGQPVPPELDTPQAAEIRNDYRTPPEIKVLMLTPENAPYIAVAAGNVQVSLSEAKEDAEAKKLARRQATDRILKGGPLLGLREKTGEFAAIVQPIRNEIKRFTTGIRTWKNLINGIADDIKNPFLDVVGVAKDIYGTYNELISAPADFALSLIAAYKEVRKAIENVWDQIESGGLWPEYVQAKYAQVESEVKAEFFSNLDEAETELDDVGAKLLKSASAPSLIPTPQGAQVAYGFDFGEATAGTTLEQIAAEYLGDPDRAIDIAIANGVALDAELEPGRMVKIPRDAPNPTDSLNEVYALDDTDKILGSDLALEAGKLSFDDVGDLKIVTRDATVGQAISSRLSETLGVRLRLGTYGIKTALGRPAMSSSFIATSIIDTVIQDPRIKTVSNFMFSGRGDALFISFDYETATGKSSYRGVL